MAFELPALPYAKDALEPHMSGRTLKFHHGKHHKKYVSKLNDAIKGTKLEGASLEEIIRASAGAGSKTAIFNNGAQSWNHTFFWHCMTPNGGGAPEGELAERIDAAFGGLEGFKDRFKSAATGQFGSGWAWLVLDGDQLKVTATANADNPLTMDQVPLLTCDLWEHAYYLDYQHRRPDFLQAFLDNLVNWSFAAEALEAASVGEPVLLRKVG
ncbi:MAG: superoxide dismutase [Kiloniellales bacterium]